MNFFDLPHALVVFPPGTSGNFVSGVIRNLIEGTTGEQSFSVSGNAHTLTDEVNTISCGILYQVPQFQSDAEKLIYYRNQIEKKYGSSQKVMVDWTHDFSNISLYRKLFPNCRILAITTETNEEKFISLILQELKNVLDPKGYVFVDDKKYRHPWRIRSIGFMQQYTGINDPEYFGSVLDTIHDEKNFNLATYLSVWRMATYYDFVNPKRMTNYMDHCLLPIYEVHPDKIFDRTNTIVCCVGPLYKDCIDEQCSVLRFTDIIKGNYNAVTIALQKLLGYDFVDSQIEYIHQSIDTYLKKQNQAVITAPSQYFEQIKKAALIRLEELKKEYLGNTPVDINPE